MMNMEELRHAGLLEAAGDPHLTEKGRDWLRALDDLEAQEVVEGMTSSMDLVISTNGLYR
jgi:hypothetical protein